MLFRSGFLGIVNWDLIVDNSTGFISKQMFRIVVCKSKCVFIHFPVCCVPSHLLGRQSGVS